MRIQVKYWIDLITPDELEKLSIGTVLYSIQGEQVRVGVNEIDPDTIHGFLAYGKRLPFWGEAFERAAAKGEQKS
jgi:hypothetical protein